ncbi:16S rRNA (cytidine(1402)-2'-O)-methyltransferase [Catellicoccus marimammalium]|uniref:Ribosomal RNA small subunit methyltransferase I n=1 Tax=Catellicoccus marimammalium M35/04/3 TaxID=1234409 RepID=K8Z898_9ENTE|nr:16S rRNA (cytidine(1402)-2'-O)-methyltransferase [Catellicoccus marimammalium]EKU27045.1 rRNA small subunit methyltransferase I [Catellicoccus marimammalium M35/04/3]
MQQQKSFQKESGNLYLVPTPIGNLEDMTFRGVRTLEEVDIIASEDTRHTQKLLNHFSITTPQISLHEHNYKERIPQLIARLEEGANMAQVSDAGMPSISDPGHELVEACIERGIPVIALPGASAGITALIASGLTAQPFLFYGFLPRKQGEAIQTLEVLKPIESTLIFYESPKRLASTFALVEKVWGGQRRCVLCRELTKRYEEYTRGTVQELLAYTQENEIKGECCLLFEGYQKEVEMISLEEVDWKQEVEKKMAEEQISSKVAIKQVAKQYGVKKQDVYQAYHQK